MQTNVNISLPPYLRKYAQAALNRTTIDDPHFASSKLLEEMRLSRTDAGEA
jgi:hypothetical protein